VTTELTHVLGGDRIKGFVVKSERRNMDDQIGRAARIAHEVNRAYCASIGDTSQLPWEMSPGWQKDSAIKGIQLHWAAMREGKELPPSASHDSWLKEKLDTGWKYGPTKNPETKEHPCCVPYEELPTEQKTKDYLFGAVARATF
jgi:hypothetical protein